MGVADTSGRSFILAIQPTRTLHLVLLLLALVLVAGCSREPGIKHPNTYTIGMGADAKRLIPFLASDSASGSIAGYIFRGLVKYDKDIRLVGDMAESWDIDSDGKTVVFHLRRGIKWHDGAEFTSDDVLFTYEAIRNPKNPTPYAADFELVSSMTAPDKYTVRVAYRKPFAPALESWAMGIIPRHVFEGKDLTSAEINRNPVGTGPYMLKEWISGQRIVLEAFGDYYEGRPNIDRVVARIIPDQATMFLELKFGGIDSMAPTPAQYKHQIGTDFFKRYFQSFRYPAFGYTYMGYNLKHPIFSEKKVRQAMAHAINKKELIAGVLLGYGSAANGPFTPSSWAFNPDVADFEYDPAKARKILSGLGWKENREGMLEKDGKSFSFTAITNSANESRLKAAQIMKQQLKAVGIDMKIMTLEWQTMLHKFIDKRQFEAVILGWSIGRDPDNYIMWHSSQTKEGEFNFVSYSNEEVDRLLVQGRETFDPAERLRIYRRIHAIITEDQPYTFLFIPDALPVLHRRFKGVELAPIGIGHDFIHWIVPEDRALWYQ